MIPVLGDWVRTRYNQIGRVTAIHDRCPEGDWWIELQEVPVTAQERKGNWVSILCHNQGSVTQPISTVTLLDEHPPTLVNSWADKYFREEVA